MIRVMKRGRRTQGFIAARRVSKGLICVAIGAAVVSPASAQSLQYVSQHLSLFNTDHPDLPSFFTLDFGPGIGRTTASITTTTFALSVNADQGTARFSGYHQELDPIILPGGFSTGNLTINIVPGSSSGTYDELSGMYHTRELYAVSFDGDLSAFGLQSPVFLPSESIGQLTLQAGEPGTVAMVWQGAGQLANPFDPNSFLDFTYFCSVNTVFAAQPATSVRLGLIPDVLNLGLTRFLESNLVGKLRTAFNGIQTGDDLAADQALGAFIGTVLQVRGGRISIGAADQLIEAASAVRAEILGDPVDDGTTLILENPRLLP